MKIGYSRTYPMPSTGQYEKIWLEDEIETNDMEVVRRAQYELKRAVQDFHFESNKAEEKRQQEEKLRIVENQEPPMTQEAKIIAAIYTCKDLTVLQSYELIAKNSFIKGDKAIQAAYEQQKQKLTT